MTNDEIRMTNVPPAPPPMIPHFSSSRERCRAARAEYRDAKRRVGIEKHETVGGRQSARHALASRLEEW